MWLMFDSAITSSVSSDCSNIILMLADDMACNARNPRPGKLMNIVYIPSCICIVHPITDFTPMHSVNVTIIFLSI